MNQEWFGFISQRSLRPALMLLPTAERCAALPLALVLAAGLASAAPAAAGLTLDALKRAPASFVADGRAPVGVREVVLCGVPHDYPAETRLCDEGFRMPSQTAGSLGRPADLGLTDDT